MVLKRLFFGYTGEDFAHLLRSQGDRTLNCSVGWQKFHRFFLETELWAVLHGEAVLRRCDSFNGKMNRKSSFMDATGEASAHLFRSREDRASNCSLGRQNLESFFPETELWAFPLGDVASSWNGSFSGKMVLQRLFPDDTVEDSVHLFRSLGDSALYHSPRRQSFKPFSWEVQLHIDMILLVARWSGKDHFWLD